MVFILFSLLYTDWTTTDNFIEKSQKLKSLWQSTAGVSYTGSEIINVHKTKEQTEHNKTLFPNPNQNNNGSFVLRHLSPVHESLPQSTHRDGLMQISPL